MALPAGGRSAGTRVHLPGDVRRLDLQARSNSHVYDMVASSALQGIGFGIGYAALGTLAVQHVPMDSTAIASGVNSLVRTTGGSIGAAVVASVLASDVIRGAVVPTLHAYVVSYVILAVGACLAAANGLRHRES